MAEEYTSKMDGILTPLYESATPLPLKIRKFCVLSEGDPAEIGIEIDNLRQAISQTLEPMLSQMEGLDDAKVTETHIATHLGWEFTDDLTRTFFPNGFGKVEALRGFLQFIEVIKERFLAVQVRAGGDGDSGSERTWLKARMREWKGIDPPLQTEEGFGDPARAFPDGQGSLIFVKIPL